MFPHLPVELIQQDLRMTHSVEITVENILEDRLNPNTSATIATPGGGRGGGGSGSAGHARSATANLLNDDESSDVNDDDDDDSEEDLVEDSSEEDEPGSGLLGATGGNHGERNLRRRNIIT